ncbi:uncharacterized protein LOC112270136 [Brachypodium distachyon]|uniref:uncharacterized protein LOC112270136 n=1 Tax=Brachypodium distachyon TaxID=15368 RepID=UPI000D0CBBA1|nr:uncharacterized protein LOC112270136 [Brachypodium distachyon]|eukprot:XP_024313658.1 uncharacterized protein LOC112270136 [Brachypodium distachyon]
MVANHLFSKKEDLNLEDLNKIFTGLLCVQQDMVHRLPPLHHGHEHMTCGSGVSLNLVPPRVQSRGGNWTPPSSMNPLGSHMLPHQPSLIQPQSVPHKTLAQPFPMQAQKMLQHTQLALSSLTPGQVHESPSLLKLPLLNSASPYNTMEPPQNNSGPCSTFEHNIEDPPLLVNSASNEFNVEDPFGYDQSAYVLSDQPYYKRFLEAETYLGYDGTDVGQAHMGNDGSTDAPTQYSVCGKDDDDGTS